MHAISRYPASRAAYRSPRPRTIELRRAANQPAKRPIAHRAWDRQDLGRRVVQRSPPARRDSGTVAVVKAGDVLGSRYRLLSPIGEGGMGAVWRARQIELDADVAIKVLHAKTAEHPGAIARFKREAKASAALRSPHVVQIVDYGVDEVTGTAFIAMELLEGESLAARLSRTQKLGPEETARWITHVARALSRAHASGVVHRDLKPANIFIVHNEDEELAKVVDFGIAKLVGREHVETATVTTTGALLGTPHYMSPEQIDPSREVDFRVDLWSLAVIACECLTGRRPFEGDTLASLAMKISLGRAEQPSSLGPVPRGFDAWFARGTALDPQQRFGSALELASTLREVVESGGVMLSEPSKVPPVTTRQELTPSVLGITTRSSASAAAKGSGRRGAVRDVVLAAGVVMIGGAGVLWAISRASAPPAGVSASPGGPSVVTSALSLGSAAPSASGADAGAPLTGTPAGSVKHAESAPVAGSRVRVLTAEPDTRAAPPEKPADAKRRASTRGRTGTRHPAGAARPASPKAETTPAPKKPVDPYDLL